MASRQTASEKSVGYDFFAFTCPHIFTVHATVFDQGCFYWEIERARKQYFHNSQPVSSAAADLWNFKRDIMFLIYPRSRLFCTAFVHYSVVFVFQWKWLGTSANKVSGAMHTIFVFFSGARFLLDGSLLLDNADFFPLARRDWWPDNSPQKITSRTHVRPCGNVRFFSPLPSGFAVSAISSNYSSQPNVSAVR